ncbi:hypothetical protein QFC19_000452 [Naganishia cerealis]|uniref:Uncharacterized protein n=1 Tax=Naganishia cerealis TaxID=610337 RepID=A0ACC2WMM8_9TREE|nr:hypothetical protein QFC19_000452 [Naganishia cerealis]
MATHEGTELVEAYDYLFKVIVVGESGTGKSCLMHHFIHDTFKENSLHTIGVEFNSKVVRIGDKSVKLQVRSSSPPSTIPLRYTTFINSEPLTNSLTTPLPNHP